MKTSTKRTGNSTPAVCRIVMALAVAAVMGGMSVTPAIARGHDDRRAQVDNGRRGGEWRGDRGRREYRPVYQAPYYYAQPVYSPPPVYYAPQPSPGINLFFPLDIRIR